MKTVAFSLLFDHMGLGNQANHYQRIDQWNADAALSFTNFLQTGLFYSKTTKFLSNPENREQFSIKNNQ